MQIALPQGSLRSWRIEDAPALVEGANNRNVWLRLRDIFPHPYTLANAEAYLGRVVRVKPAFSFCIELDGRAAGGIGLDAQDDVHHRTAEIGYWLAEPFWGRGVMTHVVRAIIGYGFTALPLDRIEAYVFSNNPTSARVLEKTGFTCEGRLRQNVVKDGQLLDSLVYSILRDEVYP
ncbi:MAG: GNAT family N-acetyltransferase [Verrucomicrobiota bacterium]|nr:GNAT family N-acetyltransferase [Verrucomicrobiota bacterium]